MAKHKISDSLRKREEQKLLFNFHKVFDFEFLTEEQNKDNFTIKNPEKATH